MNILCTKALATSSAILVMLFSATTNAQSILPTSRPAIRPSTRPDSKPATNPLVKPSPLMATFAKRIEQAHGKMAWLDQKAVQADIVLEFGGNEMLKCKLIYDMHSSKARMELADGATLVFDGEHAWVAPEESSAQMARFHLLTWSYFMAAPFKLNDPGTYLESSGMMAIDNILSYTAKLTFEKGTGDAPDDWYIIYPDRQTNKINAMAYIVSYGKDVKEAEKQPHAIVYHDYKDIQGVKLSTYWTMHHWSKEEGPHGEPIGTVKLSNIKFVTPKTDAFVKPDDAREDKLPPSNN